MLLQKQKRNTRKHAEHAAQSLLNAESTLNPDHITLSRLEKAETALADATSHIQKATADEGQTPSTIIILQAVGNAANTARDHLGQVQQDLEDAYIRDQPAMSPVNINNTMRQAASAALENTQEALALMEKAGTTPEPEFVPAPLLDAARNRAVLALAITAAVIAIGLGIYNLRVFALFATSLMFLFQQGTMITALISSTQPSGTTRRTDFYATLATSLTIVLIGTLILAGLPLRGALQIAGMTLVAVIVQWGIARALAGHSQRQKRGYQGQRR